MTAKRSSILPMLAFAIAASVAGGASAACPAADPTVVSGSVQGMFSAMAAGDLKTTRSFFAPDFYIYDGGMRFDADGILGLIQGQQQTGAVYTWKVTEPKVHFACDTAWITYVNQGGVAKAGQDTPLTWLESGVLQYRNGRWLIAFMHSTRTPAPKPAQ